MTQGYLLEVRIGVAEPASIALVPGTPLDPTSFGRSAMWRIGAEGVLDIHGYVYFDGRSLFVQSADETFPVLVNRHRVPMAWTEIRAPSTMFVGQAQVDLKVSDMLARSGALVASRSDDLVPRRGPARGPARGHLGAPQPRGSAPQMPQPITPFPAPFPEPDPSLAGAPAPQLPQGPWDGSSAEPMPLPPPTSGGAPFARGAFVPQSDGDSTRFAPLDAIARSGANPSSGRHHGMDDPRAANTSPVIPVPLPLSGAAPAPKPGSLWARAKADWYATSLPKRILFLLSPLVIASYFSLLYGDDAAKDADATSPSSSASSSSASSISGSAGSASALAAPDVSPRATAPPALGTNATAVPAAGTSTDATKSAPKTLERAAVEALSAGDLPLAIQLYERLAREHPENPAFEKAARIVRDRLDAGR